MVKMKFKIDIICMKLIILKFVYRVVCDVASDMDHLHVKIIKLVDFPYIVIDDKFYFIITK
jgi:hypothetical protein